MGISFIDEWLVAEGTESGRWYVVHTIEPRFVIEICDEDDGYSSGETLMIDECFDVLVLARLAREAGEIFARYDKELENEQD